MQVFFQESLVDLLDTSIFWKVFATSSIAIPILSFCCIKTWAKDDWAYHPIVRNLIKFSNNNSNWQSVARDIDREYRG